MQDAKQHHHVCLCQLLRRHLGLLCVLDVLLLLLQSAASLPLAAMSVILNPKTPLSAYLSFRQIFCPTDEAHHTRGILQAGHGLRAAHCSKRCPRHPAVADIKGATSLADARNNSVGCLPIYC